MKSIITLTLSALICLGNVTMNAMDSKATNSTGALVSTESTALAKAAQTEQTYKAVARITVVDYQSVQKAKGERPKVVNLEAVKEEVRRELLSQQQQQVAAPQVVAIDEVRRELQTQQQRELSLIQKYPKTAIFGFGTVCFLCGLYFPEIRESISSKMSSGTNAGQ